MTGRILLTKSSPAVKFSISVLSRLSEVTVQATLTYALVIELSPRQITLVCVVRLPEGELRDLANRLNERIESIDADKQEELEAKVRAEIEAQDAELAGLDDEETND